MNKRYAAVWPEGEPSKAVWAQSWLHLQWLQFWVGIKTYWPTPLHAKRVCAWLPAYPVPFNTPAIKVAEVCEEYFKNDARRSS